MAQRNPVALVVGAGDYIGAPTAKRFAAGVDTAWVRERIRERTGSDGVPAGRLMGPKSVADTYWQLHQQSRDAWTFEPDVRPFGEPW